MIDFFRTFSIFFSALVGSSNSVDSKQEPSPHPVVIVDEVDDDEDLSVIPVWFFPTNKIFVFHSALRCVRHFSRSHSCHTMLYNVSFHSLSRMTMMNHRL